MGKFPRKVTVFKCTECDETEEDEDDLIEEVDAYKPDMSVELTLDRDDCWEEVKAFKCKKCGELAEDKSDLVEEVEQWQCVDCDTFHEDKKMLTTVVNKIQKMFRKLRCKSGHHSWYRLFPFGSNDGVHIITHSECRYCNAVGNMQERKIIPKEEIWWQECPEDIKIEDIRGTGWMM